MKKILFSMLFTLTTLMAYGLSYNVTVPAGTKACYIAGEMNNWTQQVMTKTDDTHYFLDIPNATTSQQYKYCSGPDWGYEELDGAGSVINNRTYKAADVVQKWRAVYTPVLPGVTYKVAVPAGTKACYIAGEMNSWIQQEMTKTDDTHYELNIPTATQSQKYKYCSGPDWTYEELDNSGVKIMNRSYSATDIVLRWAAVYDPNAAVTPIANSLQVSSGSVVRYAFNSLIIGSRTVDVWLPAGYSAAKKYAVLYMHDGQMLFDATSTWNGQEWKVDETLTQLMTAGEIKDVIVVGIWNSDNRYGEYYPEKTLDYLPSAIKTSKSAEMNNDPKADEYLSFIVNDVKPFIDKTYSVNTDVSNTFIAGSSMGGLISWYAMCEYPTIFGAAICMSTHWGVVNTDDASIPDSFRKYLLNKLPSPSSHSIYFDHGTVGLDANYPQNQVLADTIMRYKGYTAANWKTQVFTGDDHNETCWANRFNFPVKFMLKEVITPYDELAIQNKIEVLSHHGRIWNSPAFSSFKYPFKLLTATEYQTQKPIDAFAFDAGFVAADGTINICEPTTTEQKAVFSNSTQVALYYLCQSYMYHFYQTRNLPLLFKVGFPVFEAGIIPNDATIKTAVNAYGGSFSSFNVLNDRTTFINNNGLAVAGAFGEFMNVFKNWGYPLIININATGFDAASWWWNVDNLAGLLDDFNRYIYNRFLQSDENLRVKLYVETEHFKFYTRPVDGALNFPSFSTWSEAAYNTYVTNFNVHHGEKVSFFTLPSCIDGDLEGKPCNGLPPERLTGGTAWSSGVHSTCASTADELRFFEGMCEHELAHSFQGIFPQGTVTAWLNEGFPSFCSDGPIEGDKLTELRQSGIDCMTAAIKYFGHRPTYEETRIYPSPDYGYYTLGYFFIDYQYRKGGYPLIKAIQMNDLAAYQSLGYSSAQAFLEDFYFDFDIRVQQKQIATLINPVTTVDETNSTVNISWTPLKAGVKLNVLVSTDDAKTWTEVVNRTTGTSCVWNSGNMSTRFYIKISAPDNLDVSTTYGPFIKTDLTKLNITLPVLNNYLISGDTTSIRWATTGIQNIKIDYTLNNGTNWATIANSTSTSANTYTWVVPSGITGSCKVRLTDVTNNANSSVSEVFTIVTPNEVGGPYLYDKNTLLLLHFDNNLNNRSNQSPNAVGDVLNLTGEASTIANLGLSYKNSSAISVPHHANLSLTGDWTIEAWVKLTSYAANNNMYIFWKPGDTDAYQSNYSLEVNPWWGNVFYGYTFSELNNRLGITTGNALLNEWYHVAFVRDTQKKQLKVIVHDKNRTQIAVADVGYTATTLLTSSKDLLLGTNLSGYIDEVRISNIVRSFVGTDLKTPQHQKHVVIYPNPASSKITLLTKNQFNSTTTIRFINANGQQVFVNSYTAADKIELNLNGLSKGVYLVKISSDAYVETQRLIVK